MYSFAMVILPFSVFLASILPPFSRSFSYSVTPVRCPDGPSAWAVVPLFAAQHTTNSGCDCLARQRSMPVAARHLDKIQGVEYTSYDKWTGVLVFMPAERREHRQPSNLIWVMPA